MIVQNKKSNIFIALSITLVIFFHQYESLIPGVTLGELLLVISVFFVVVIQKKKDIIVTNCKGLLVYFYIGLLLLSMSIFLQGFAFPAIGLEKTASRWIRYLSYVFFCIVLSENISIKKEILQVYRIACIIVCIYTIAQTIVYFLSSVMLPVKILPLPESNAISTDQLISSFDEGYFRAFGPFHEPSYLAKFLCPGFCFAMYGWCSENKKIELLTFFLFFITIAISTSSQGLAVLIFTFFCNSLAKETNRFKKIIFSIGLILLLFSLWNFFCSFRSIERLTSISLSSSAGYSSGLRLFRGFAFWYEMPLIYKIIGVGFGNIANFAIQFDIKTAFDYFVYSISALEYVNGISGVLVETGLIGFVFFIIFVISSFRKVNIIGKVLLGQFLLLCISGTMLLSPTSVFYIIMIFLNRKIIYVGGRND